jgi:hypothetical protein
MQKSAITAHLSPPPNNLWVFLSDFRFFAETVPLSFLQLLDHHAIRLEGVFELSNDFGALIR